ncbi:toxin Cry1Ac domain D-VI-related protein [Bacillus cytotoxicus]
MLKEREATQLKNAQQAVNALFSDDKHTILNDSLTEKEIKEAKQKSGTCIKFT